ncbi:MAG: ATP dependent transcriptional activator [Candidatus Scalindua brodae]|uniref:ATP dependent transcriptional activator n=1 Tax=Candidatus Scalindua brodae TaxID=237368 RepID=A0A0B0ECR5_9BACT|nr:MAG: ATP dependent transcriptional activator [Candidatus Scalindua brodae]
MRNEPTSLAKITSPRYEKILPRERLFHLLDSGSKRPIIWISAQAGSGKTALTASYLKERKLPHLWYRLDARDNDNAAFFHNFGLAAKKAVPRKHRSLPLLTPEYLTNISAFTTQYFEELYGLLRSSTFLVFDNYQDLPSGSAFHEIIRDGLSLIPDGITVIFISRHCPPPALARYRVNNTMTLLGWHELKLTEDEVFAVVRLYREIYHKNRQDKMIKQLHETTQGWAAGLILLLEQAATGNMKTDTFTEENHRAVFNYFANEILLKTDKETQDFLYKTAFFPAILARTAEQLTRNPKANQILSTLTAENCFTYKRTEGSQAYEYHPLFREYLLFRAEEVFKKEGLAQVQCDAAKALETAGQTEEAVELFCKAGNWDEMIRLVLQLAPALISQGRYRTLETWINKLPESVTGQTAWLQYWSGICHIPFDTAKARRHFESAFKEFEAQDDQTGTLFSWCGFVDAVIYQCDDFTILDRWIEWLDEYVKIYLNFPSQELDGRVACSMSNALMYRQMERPDVSKWFDRAWSLARKNGDNNLLMQVGFSLMYYYLRLGYHIKARILLEKLQTLPSSDKPSPLAMIMLKIMDSHTQLWSGSCDAGLCALHEGIKIAKASEVHIKDSLLYAQGSYFLLSMGDAPGAREYLKKMASA